MSSTTNVSAKKTIRIVDVSIRDGNQSLWGSVGLNTARVASIAPTMERVGFDALDITSSTAMGMEVRTYKENPWERLRLLRRLMPSTPFQFIGTGIRFISWEAQHPEFLQLVYDRLVASGVDRYVVLDPMHDVDAMRRTSHMYKQAGATTVIAALVFTISDLHTDEWYANLAQTLAASPDIDRFYIKDPSGLLSPMRARTLITAVQARIEQKPLELHSHCIIGQAPLTYIEAAATGIYGLHVGSGALGEGASLPEARRTVRNLQQMGYEIDVDTEALTHVCNYFTELAETEMYPKGKPQSFDAAFLRHQVAGGVMATTRRQLAELKLEHLFDAVIEEVNDVRAELGYPIMVTPFPQMVCTQALYNVIGKERYDNISDQIIMYALEKFGRPSSPIAPNILDRILSLPRARELAKNSELIPLSETRKKFRNGINDEELLLRAVLPEEMVDEMILNTKVNTHYNPKARKIRNAIRQQLLPPTTYPTEDDIQISFSQANDEEVSP